MNASSGRAPCRVIVADDEPIAAAALAAELRRLGADVVAVTGGGAAAVAACAVHSPDACFTDIVMPDVDGLTVAATLRRAAPRTAVVFVSAHPHYAVAAFGADVVDYLLKPLRRERLADALRRVLRARDSAAIGGIQGNVATAPAPVSQDAMGPTGVAAGEDRLLVTERGAVHVVAIDDLEWVQADDYAVWLHTAARSWLLRERLHRLEARLAAAGFVRVHRSALVRRSAITRLEWVDPGAAVAVLASGARVRVARDRIAVLRLLLTQGGDGARLP
ncbi:MAG: response regulator transcription factor [Gemmatimonadota bacterium]